MTSTPPGIFMPASNHSGPMAAHLGVVLHVQEGNGSIFNEANNPASLASYTWWVAKDGRIERYLDPNMTAWAHKAGNGTYTSIGTEGFVAEPLTDAQLASCAEIVAWDSHEYGWPRQLTETPGVPGFGWHGMGCQFDWGHCVCPGPIRREQRQAILDLIQGANDMTPEQSKLLQDVHDALYTEQDKIPGGAAWNLTQILIDVRQLQTDVAAIKAKIQA